MAPLIYDGTEVKSIKYVKNGITKEIDKLIFNGVTVFQKESGGDYMTVKPIADGVILLATNDNDIDLYESMYTVPNGITYNSYLITGNTKTALINTSMSWAASGFISALGTRLNGRLLDYLIITDSEPDMSGCLEEVLTNCPDVNLVGNAKTLQILKQLYPNLDTLCPEERRITVTEGGTLSLGDRTLTFAMAPMVTFPDVFVCYDDKEKILFSADSFSRYGRLGDDQDWTIEAGRYYFSVVAKYGTQVRALLRKISALDIQTICPSHGMFLNENLGYYIDKYDKWSSYEFENEGYVIFYASAYGHTKDAALQLAQGLGSSAHLFDVTRNDLTDLIVAAFRYSKSVFASCTINAGMHPAMETLLQALQDRSFQNRTVGLIENGSWAPSAIRAMNAILETLKNITVLDSAVTIRRALDADSIAALSALQTALQG